MRLRLTLQNERFARLPIDHYHLLRATLFHQLRLSDAEFARELHDTGFGDGSDTGRRYKLFTFSGLRVPRPARPRLLGDRMELAPGPVHWFIASPKDDTLRHAVTGLLEAQGGVRIGDNMFTLTAMEALPDPVFTEKMAFTCLTPVVAAVASETHQTARYLRPSDGAELSEAVRRNAVRKYRALHGAEPARTDLSLSLSAEYLARASHGCTKKVTIPGSGGVIDVIGTFAPLTLSGSPELMKIAYECGLGEKNGSGMGMIEVDNG